MVADLTLHYHWPPCAALALPLSSLMWWHAQALRQTSLPEPSP
ncbi:MAG: GpE family phage tail protein [Burkholderiales bacterium]|nr:GpE family phage tail protein [Burkholderiales bacterium]